MPPSLLLVVAAHLLLFHRRMRERGDTGQITRAEEIASNLKYLHAKMDSVMAHLQIPAVAAPMEMADR